MGNCPSAGRCTRGAGQRQDLLVPPPALLGRSFDTPGFAGLLRMRWWVCRYTNDLILSRPRSGRVEGSAKRARLNAPLPLDQPVPLQEEAEVEELEAELL